MNQEILQEIGLNKSESQVYLALLELGEAKTGQICNKLNIPNSHIYTDLDSLTKKGLVS
jgi:sugar-specific transcriptional regulator TrmB